MKNKKFFTTRLLSFMLLTAFLFSCSAQRYSVNELNDLLTNERITSPNAIFSVLRPHDWRGIYENKYNSAEIWLVKDDYSETLSLNRISLTKTTDVSVLLDAAIKYREINYGSELRDLQRITEIIDEEKIPGFKYANKKGKNVFTYLYTRNNFFVEATLTTSKNEVDPVVFAVLNSIK